LADNRNPRRRWFLASPTHHKNVIGNNTAWERNPTLCHPERSRC
jgi:hypothetical protein